MSYEVYRTALLSQKLEGLEKDLQERVDKIEGQLKENPFVGKPLGYKWFREKRLNKHRIYYLIYEEFNAVYIITISDKKDQQKIINTTKIFLDRYKEEIKTLIKQ